MTTLHPVATAFSTSGSSGLYDRARPSYPPKTVAHILTALQKYHTSKSDQNGLNIVELGAGTGIFTRMLVSPPEDPATPQPPLSKVVAVEPNEGMRSAFIKGFQKKGVSVGAAIDGEEKVNVLPGTFLETPIPDNWADAIVIAQAFHWSHPNYSAALTEFSRVLKPGAPLILLWNLEDRTLEETYPWVAKIRDIYEAYENGTPQYRLMWWKKIFELDEYKNNFVEEPEYILTRRNLRVTVDMVVEVMLSKSYITALPEDEKAKVSARVREVLEKDGAAARGVDGWFEFPYTTDLYVIWKKQ